MLNKIRWYLVKLLVGDGSFIRNCVIEGKISIREDHFICSNSFINDSYVYVGSSGSRFPPLKNKQERTGG